MPIMIPGMSEKSEAPIVHRPKRNIASANIVRIRDVDHFGYPLQPYGPADTEDQSSFPALHSCLILDGDTVYKDPEITNFSLS